MTDFLSKEPFKSIFEKMQKINPNVTYCYRSGELYDFFPPISKQKANSLWLEIINDFNEIDYDNLTIDEKFFLGEFHQAVMNEFSQFDINL